MWWCNDRCDSTLLIIIGYMNILEDMLRGENLRWRSSLKNQPLRERTCVQMESSEGAIRIEWICSKNNGFLHSWRIKISLGELFWRTCTGSLGETGGILRCRLRCWTRILQDWLSRFLKALREQLKENDQFNVVKEFAGPVLEIPLEYDQILKGGRFWDDVNGGYLPEDLVVSEMWRDWLGTFRRCLRDCSNAKVKGCRHETVRPRLGGHRQVCGSNMQVNSIEVVCKRKQNEEAR